MNSDKSSLGDRIRAVASKFQNEKRLQIQATSRILGAAAELAESQDQLINEVTEIMVSDLNEIHNSESYYSIESLKQQFSSLKSAKQHFHLKARSWQTLADQLNHGKAISQVKEPHTLPMSKDNQNSNTELLQRIEEIEVQVRLMRQDLNLLMSKLIQE